MAHEISLLLREYRRLYPEERALVSRFTALLEEGERAFSRSREEGHLTASAWVLDASGERVLLIHHRKLNRWLQPGGHADGDLDLLRVASREVLEETGVTASPRGPLEILDLDIHRIPARKEVGEHDHFDVRFLLFASVGQEPAGNDETHGARWVRLEEIEKLTREESILRMREKARQRGGG